MARRQAKHVVYNRGKWVVRTHDQSTVKSANVYGTQREAVRDARALAKRDGVELVIHGRDGRIREVDSYRDRASVDKLLPTG